MEFLSHRAGTELGRLKEAGSKLRPLTLTAPVRGSRLQSSVPVPQPRTQAFLPQTWPGPT